MMPIANAAVPTLLMVWPMLAVWTLLGAIAIEAVTYRFAFDLPMRTCLAVSARANAFSTFIGIPAAGLTMFFAFLIGSMFFGDAPQNNSWWATYLMSMVMIWDNQGPQSAQYAGMLTLLTFFLAASALTERRFIVALDSDRPAFGARIVWLAHLASYVPLYLLFFSQVR